MITKNMLFTSLFLLGISVHQFIGVNKASASKSAEQPGDTVFSRFHTLSIHIKDPAVHDSVFHFLKDKLQLPVYYNPISFGERRYAGIFAGNLVLEPCGPYTQFDYATSNFRAIFFGLTFEPAISISSTATVLQQKNIKHDVAGDEYIYLKDSLLCGENIYFSIMDKHDRKKDHVKLDSLRSAMNSNFVPGLGIDYVKEVQIGYSTDSNLNQWKELISPSELKQGNVWELNNEMNFSFIQGSIKEVKGIIFKVKSLEKAKVYFKEKGLLGTENNGTIAIDPKKSFGLSICFTE